MGVGLSILLSFVLIFANGYFSMSEMALVNARRPLLEREADEGDRKARVASDLAADPNSFLATIQVAITLVGFFSSAVASTNLSDPFARWMSSFGVGWLTAIAPGLAPILITLTVSYVSIVIGELVPKRIAMADPERISKAVASSLVVFKKIAKPLVWLTSASANGLSKLLRIKEVDEGQVSEEEIKYMVAEQEDLTDDEKRMIHDVFELGDTAARQVMVPRVDVTGVEDTLTVSQTLAVIHETAYSRLPVYHEDMDQILGVVNIKDLIQPVLDGKGDLPVTAYMRECMFVPDTKDLLPLLEEMRSERTQVAIVIDEYGGTAGLITVEDIVEEIVGEIEDEFDEEEEELTRVNEREWNVDGTFPITDAVELGWPLEPSAEYETVAGWIMDEVDQLPETGDTFCQDGWTFTVTAMDGRRIETVHVLAPAPDAPCEDPEE